MKELIEEYTRRHDQVLVQVAVNLGKHLESLFTGVRHVDRIGARAKSPKRFLDKATKKEDDGRPKYKKPLSEIQDQIGARVIVFYKQDVKIAREVIEKYFKPIEDKEYVPESQWEFGYFGQHYILALPKDVVPAGTKDSDVPRFFELQIKTLFQHAWSESNHDLGYKPANELTADDQRSLAFAAAQAWGADREFEDLFTRQEIQVRE